MARDIVIPADAGAVVIVDLDAIAENYRLIQSTCPGAEVGAAVKADAYGLGVGPVTAALSDAGCTTFFVATPAEGTHLRKTNATAEIVVLNGPEPGNIATLLDSRLTPTLNSLPQIETWAAASANAPMEAWLHIDTGMNRLGLGPGELEALIAKPARLDGIRISTILSHLACADTPDHPMNAAQRDSFTATCELLTAITGPVRTSLANSPGVFLGSEYHFNMVRPGASLYGIRPSAERPNPMKQVVEIYTKILQVRDVDTPMTVGYGAAHQVTGTRRIATLAAGYADGYPRAAGNTAGHTEGKSMCAFIDGQPAPLAGRISMDLITIDVTDLPAALCRPGQTVELLGPNVTPDDLADAAGTIAYEVLSRLGPRLQVEYRGGTN
ncbi:MAG: alanine racemase [Rhodospirillaceae bacterium]|jgi:alanine racemase|nr:alanine racemase [Rhodospirillaceae bacterium]MBT6404365.1 alanine racemase [Rhodospirillaceae bacterium]MBT6537142.1 alanine racemase [Rhodospirillaceae bacterium]MBT7363009.1 alanine racemase [Rhodospirillaceae bacterium]